MYRLLIILLFGFVSLSVANIPEGYSRIIGGENDSLPYQVSIQEYHSHICGGCLITNRLILTAAHCVVNKNLASLQVRLGSKYWNSGGVLRNCSAKNVHPNYISKTMENDVAILKLDSNVNYSETIQRISLAATNPSDGEKAKVSGWGVQEEGSLSIPVNLKSAIVEIISRAVCASKSYKYLTFIKKTMICAKGNGKDACQGDSGGPLVLSSNGRLIGITSWGYGCAEDGYPGVYSSVPDLRTWIEQTAKQLK